MGIFNMDFSQFPAGERIVYNTLEQQLQNERDLHSRVKAAPLQGFHFKEAEIPVDLNLNQSVNLSSYDLIKTLMNKCFTNADMKEIEKLIVTFGIDSLAKTISDERDSSIMDLFRNKQFLTCLRFTISGRSLSYETKVYLNSLILQEHVLQTIPELDGLYKGLAQEVNKECISLVTGINSKTKTLHKMDPDSVVWMVVNRFSSFDITDEKNIQRLNQSILYSNQDAKVFTVETITEIYCALFERLGSLFNATWFDITGMDNPNCQEKMMNQTYAILNILEAQAHNVIYAVLYGARDRCIRESTLGVSHMRMPLESIPKEYVHIWSILPQV